ncbi:hypothetical protein CI109_101412 [Kwoniella shandongensis]|uniref:U1 small nuclear ribonucleoprotein C n=1 Tax=Kwoniella shandongensis TaxID=1734106 RepID=A0AAJ8LDC5_9TREE
MGKYYCDYCDIYLTHDSMNARKAHNTGRNHISNVRDYFASLGHDKAQNIIDQIIQQHESGGRTQMMMAPSMRLGAGFMNPLATQPGFPPPFPPSGGPGGPPNGYPSQPPPSFRPPFPPNGLNGAPPPFPPPNGFPQMGGAPPPFPPQQHQQGMPPFRPPPPNGFQGIALPPNQQGSGSPGGVGAPPAFTPAQGGGGQGGAAPGIHPDRLRMMGV